MDLITNPAGLRVLDSLIRLITDKKEVAKVIAEIDEAREKANVRIAAVGKIGDIDRLVDAVAVNLQESIVTLADAKTEAAGILRKAGVKATSERQKQKEASNILERQESRDAALTAREQSVGAREVELQRAMDQAAELQLEATELKATADERMEEAQKQLKILERAIAQIQ
jgi:hypothetical protein